MHTVIGDASGGRLDKLLATALPELSRSRIKTLIKAGHVQADEVTVSDAGHRVKPGVAYLLRLPAAVPAAPAPESIPLVVVHEDAEIIVVDKPPGLVVHPAAGHATGTLVNALVAHCGDSLSGIGGVRRPGIVHRLDKDTSGLMVVAKTDRAHRALAEQFAAHGRDGRLHRAYLAIVWGVPRPAAGRIEARLGRSGANRTKIAVIGARRLAPDSDTEQAADEAPGRHAVTHYEVVASYAAGRQVPGSAGATGTQAPDWARPRAASRTAARAGGRAMAAADVVASLVRCRLETGRTHQVRVHMAHHGHPLLGDAVYGTGFLSSRGRLGPKARAALDALGRQALHAAELAFEHPRSGRRLSFASDPPPDMAALRQTLMDWS